jgi:lipopolysaccharide transport system permease protein
MSEWRSLPGSENMQSTLRKVEINNQDTPEEFHVRIEPVSKITGFKLRELWEFRELLYFFTWRDVKVRYKQTLLGATWAILQPFMSMVVFSLFFGRLAKIGSDGLPYPIFNYAALLPWSYFSGALSGAAHSLVGSSHMITKIYFPRLILPISAVISGLVDFAFAFLVLIGMMLYYQIQPTIYVLLLPFLLLLAMITAIGVGLWFSAFNVRYRDVRYIVPFLVQLWMFGTPVVYSSSLLSEPWRTLYGLNPMVGVVEGFRWALLGSNPPGPMLWLSIIVALVLFITGLLYFRKMETTFADEV